MKTCLFDRSALPPAQSFYQREVGELRRADRKGWARPKRGCPFHASESKSSFFVNVVNGGFYCFSCGAKGGDVLEFVRLQYGLSFPDALKHFQIETDYESKPKPKERPMPLDQSLARKLAMAVEYGMEMPADASE